MEQRKINVFTVDDVA